MERTAKRAANTEDALLVLARGGALIHLLEDDSWVLSYGEGREQPVAARWVEPLRADGLLEIVAYHEERFEQFALTPQGRELAADFDRAVPDRPDAVAGVPAPKEQSKANALDGDWRVVMLVRLQHIEDDDADEEGSPFLCWTGQGDDLERLVLRMDRLDELRDIDPYLAEMHYEVPSRVWRLSPEAQEAMDLTPGLNGHILLIRGEPDTLLPRDAEEEEDADVTLCVDGTSMYFHAHLENGAMAISSDVDPSELLGAVMRALHDARKNPPHETSKPSTT